MIESKNTYIAGRQPLYLWITNYFVTHKYVSPDGVNFNVHGYSAKEVQETMNRLPEEGYWYNMENNGNSLKVGKAVRQQNA